ncbi:hypothetical protein [Streptomyces sp. NPDC000410]|uniref:hypothetical protein n=1 Tax=Streptomyces sp. NPDC000410 TaxID=3154254 RepID=UPI00332F62E2
MDVDTGPAPVDSALAPIDVGGTSLDFDPTTHTTSPTTSDTTTSDATDTSDTTTSDATDTSTISSAGSPSANGSQPQEIGQARTGQSSVAGSTTTGQDTGSGEQNTPGRGLHQPDTAQRHPDQGVTPNASKSPVTVSGPHPGDGTSSPLQSTLRGASTNLTTAQTSDALRAEVRNQEGSPQVAYQIKQDKDLAGSDTTTHKAVELTRHLALGEPENLSLSPEPGTEYAPPATHVVLSGRPTTTSQPSELFQFPSFEEGPGASDVSDSEPEYDHDSAEEEPPGTDHNALEESSDREHSQCQHPDEQQDQGQNKVEDEEFTPSADTGGYQSAGHLVQDLLDAMVPQTAHSDGTEASGTELLGRDLFGLRKAAPPPPFLAGHDHSKLTAEQTVEFFNLLNLANPDQAPSHAQMRPDAIEPASGSTHVHEPSDEDRHNWAPGDVPPLPEVLETPNTIHSIWLGGPLRDDIWKMREFRDNLALRARTLRSEAKVVLWTDVPRSMFERAAQPPTETDSPELVNVRDMLDWAQASRITLLQVREVFHADAPMSLHEHFMTEMLKQTGPGYAAASDILRLEILHRFGGIYCDGGDNWISTLRFIREALTSREAYGLVAERGTLSNSVFVMAKGHPFAAVYLDVIAEQYTKTQHELLPEFGAIPAEVFTDTAFSPRRHSVMARTGPDALHDVAKRLGLPDYRHLPTVKGFRVRSSLAWMDPPVSSNAPGTTVAVSKAETLSMAKKAVHTLVRDLHNRDGDLHVTQVDDMLSGHPQKDLIWEGAIKFLSTQPDLASRVRTITDRRSEPGSDHAVHLPAAALEFLDFDSPPTRGETPLEWLAEQQTPVRLRQSTPSPGPDVVKRRFKAFLDNPPTPAPTPTAALPAFEPGLAPRSLFNQGYFFPHPDHDTHTPQAFFHLPQHARLTSLVMHGHGGQPTVEGTGLNGVDFHHYARANRLWNGSTLLLMFGCGQLGGPHSTAADTARTAGGWVLAPTAKESGVQALTGHFVSTLYESPPQPTRPFALHGPNGEYLPLHNNLTDSLTELGLTHPYTSHQHTGLITLGRLQKGKGKEPEQIPPNTFQAEPLTTHLTQSTPITEPPTIATAAQLAYGLAPVPEPLPEVQRRLWPHFVPETPSHIGKVHKLLLKNPEYERAFRAARGVWDNETLTDHKAQQEFHRIVTTERLHSTTAELWWQHLYWLNLDDRQPWNQIPGNTPLPAHADIGEIDPAPPPAPEWLSIPS